MELLLIILLGSYNHCGLFCIDDKSALFYARGN